MVATSPLAKVYRAWLLRKLQWPMRDNETLFASLSHVSEALAIWKDDYNHQASLPPAVCAKTSAPGNATGRDAALH
jgi:hypothetical protein